MRGTRFIIFCLSFYLLISHPAKAEPRPVILALGDSLTAGFGVKEEESYPYLLERRLHEKGHQHKVVNAGVSGDTTAGGLRRLSWLLKHKPDIVILELGANDGLRGLPIAAMRKNLEKIITISKNQGAKVLLAGMKIPPNYGKNYTEAFEESFHLLAEKHSLPLIPFFLQDVAAKRELIQPDGIHPKARGYLIVIETVWTHLEPLLSPTKNIEPSSSSPPNPG